MAFISISRSSVTEVWKSDFREEFDGCRVKKTTPVKYEKKDENVTKIRMKYHINKGMVRKRTMALFELKQAKKFMAFYTITFPEGTGDMTAYRILNITLTRCREEYGKFPYLWVAERQKNGTIHFHMVVMKYMSVRKVNDYVKASLMNREGVSQEEKKKLENYNGVDVDNVWYPKPRKGQKRRFRRNEKDAAKMVSYYITKYMSKSETKFIHLAWYCSQDVSRLSTKQRIDMCELSEAMMFFLKNKEGWECEEFDWGRVYLVPFDTDILKYTNIRERNQKMIDERIAKGACVC